MILDPEIPDTTNKTITESAFYGFWEVFRISTENGSKPIYPWLGERFKYYFLDEMMYICSRSGQTCHGTWGISEKNKGGKNKLFLVLDHQVAYEIVNVFPDDMTLSDGRHKYYLVRKL